MKKLLSFTGCIVSCLVTACGGVAKLPIDPTTTEPPGTLISYESSSTFTAKYLQDEVYKGLCPSGTDCTTNLQNATVDFNYHNENITTNTTNYTMFYSTVGVLAENRKVSGGVIIPNVPESQIKGVVLYYHETEVSKSDVPSCFHGSKAGINYCVSDDPQTYGEALGGIIASQGYIVVIPDYVGLGVDSKVMHPYILHPEVNALSGLYMLQANESMLKKLGYSIQNRNLYITGYSEGGAYALWSSDLVQNLAPNFLAKLNLKLKATIGASGAYDLVNAQMPMEKDNISEGDKYNIANNDNATYAKPTVSSYVMTSYGFYDSKQTYNNVFNTELGNGFYYCVGCMQYFGAAYKIPELYLKNLKDSDVKAALYLSALSVSYGPQNANNSIGPLVNTSILSDQNFMKLLESASITNWKTVTPVTLINLAQDSVVTNLNTQGAYTGLVAAQSGADLVRIVAIENTRGKSHYMINYRDPITDQVSLMTLDHIGSSYYQLIAILDAIEFYHTK